MWKVSQTFFSRAGRARDRGIDRSLARSKKKMVKPYYEEKGITLHQGDCLEVMRSIPDASIDACITDPPYGTTACSWDAVIPFAPMWAELKRIVKKNGAIVLFGSQPFTSALVMSNPQMFRYEWIWDKKRPTGHLDADRRPLRQHEGIAVFYREQCTYNPEIHTNKLRRDFRGSTKDCHTLVYNQQRSYISEVGPETSLPRSIIEQTAVIGNSAEKVEHPNQKPLELIRYLIRTYTNEGDTVLDFTCGSGTTGVACVIEKRSAVLIEQDAGYCDVSVARIKRAQGIACDIPKRVKQYAPTPLFEAVA